jgi:hypothetical protein
MTINGGLLQLIANGIQDRPITYNPEITFFKTIYKKHTNFCICTDENNLGLLESKKENSKIISRNGDLLYNLYFKIVFSDINIATTTMNTINITNPINQYDIIYENNYCLFFYVSDKNTWYLIPENILIQYPININILISIDIPSNYNYINNLNYFQINLISNTLWNKLINNINISNIDTLNSILTLIYNQKKNNLFNLFWYNNIIINNGEIQQYLKYIYDSNIVLSTPNYDIDVVYTYCNNNLLNFNLYINNTINTNSIIL